MVKTLINFAFSTGALTVYGLGTLVFTLPQVLTSRT